MGKKDRISKKVRESKSIWFSNIPNALTISRIFLTLIVIYLISTDSSPFEIISVFVFAALTDLFDGRIARSFKWESEFGRKADMVADRFLWVGTSLAILFSYGIRNDLSFEYGIQLLMIMSREIISAPFAMVAFFEGKKIPQARQIAKLTTFLQGFAIPFLILGIYYPVILPASFMLSSVILITGAMSALYYIRDIKE